jgi:predicted acylesterase/phospholipase RssA
MSGAAMFRLHSPGPKRILALDGGGTHGIITIGFLERMERLLGEATGRGEDFRLCEFFDLIGGTSVGSMIATMLAMGERASSIRERFLQWGPKIFAGRKTFFGPSGFDARELLDRIRSVTGTDTTLGTDALKTGLAIVTKRVDTGAVWVLCNNPKLKSWNDGPREENSPPAWDGSQHYSLPLLIHASTAEPYRLTPVLLRISDQQRGVFVDGGVSPHNNPALLLFLMATTKGYQLNWHTGADNLLIISVGAGRHRVRMPTRKPPMLLRMASAISGRAREDLAAAAFTADTLLGVMHDCNQQVVQVLQGLSEPRLPWRTDAEPGDHLSGRGGGGVKDHLLSFQRYDLGLQEGVMDLPFGQPVPADQLPALQALDNPAAMEQLYELTVQTARHQVSLGDFQRFLPQKPAEGKAFAAV